MGKWNQRRRQHFLEKLLSEYSKWGAGKCHCIFATFTNSVVVITSIYNGLIYNGLSILRLPSFCGKMGWGGWSNLFYNRGAWNFSLGQFLDQVGKRLIVINFGLQKYEANALGLVKSWGSIRKAWCFFEREQEVFQLGLRRNSSLDAKMMIWHSRLVWM